MIKDLISIVICLFGFGIVNGSTGFCWLLFGFIIFFAGVGFWAIGKEGSESE